MLPKVVCGRCAHVHEGVAGTCAECQETGRRHWAHSVVRSKKEELP